MRSEKMKEENYMHVGFLSNPVVIIAVGTCVLAWMTKSIQKRQRNKNRLGRILEHKIPAYKIGRGDGITSFYRPDSRG